MLTVFRIPSFYTEKDNVPGFSCRSTTLDLLHSFCFYQLSFLRFAQATFFTWADWSSIILVFSRQVDLWCTTSHWSHCSKFFKTLGKILQKRLFQGSFFSVNDVFHAGNWTKLLFNLGNWWLIVHSNWSWGSYYLRHSQNDYFVAVQLLYTLHSFDHES